MTDDRPTELDVADSIVADYCALSGLTRDQLLGPSRAADVVAVRHAAMYDIWLDTSLSTVAIGRLFNRHHTTVLHALDKRRLALLGRSQRAGFPA